MYYVKRKVKKNKIKEVGNINGLVVKPKSKAKEVSIIDKEFANEYVKKQMDKKFKNMYKKIYTYLTEDEGSEEGMKACLSEIEKLKSIIFYKYQEFMKNKLYKEYLAKIILTTEELKRKDSEREMFNEFIKNLPKQFNYPELEERGRSR